MADHPAIEGGEEERERRSERTKSFADKARAFRRRTVQKVMVAVGKADSSVDEEFEELTKKFFALDKNVQDVHKDLMHYIEAKRTMLMAGNSVAEGMLPIFDRQAPLRHVAVQFKDLQMFLDATVKPDVDAAFLERVIEPLQKQIKEFGEVKIRIEKRSRLLLDYDSYRRKVKALAEKSSSDKKLPEKEKKLAEALKKFNEVNERLLEELQLMDENKSIVLQRPLVELLKIQTKFYSKAFEEFKKASSILADPSVERTMAESEKGHSEACAALQTKSLEDFLSGPPPAPTSAPGKVAPAAASLIDMDDFTATSAAPSGVTKAAPVTAATPSAAAGGSSGVKNAVAAMGGVPMAGMGGVGGAAKGGVPMNTLAAAAKTPAVTSAATNVAVAAAPAVAATAISAANLKPVPKPAPPAKLVTCTALYDYEAAEDTELSMSEGDVITVLKQDDTGWWQGRLEKKNKVGWFPMNYVKLNE